MINLRVPDVRTSCCHAPVVVDPAGPRFLEMVLCLVCQCCGKHAGSPGPEDLAEGLGEAESP